MNMEKILVVTDRDGTVIEDEGNFPGSDANPPEKFRLMGGVVEGFRLLRDVPDVDLKIVMITNQSGPARKKITGSVKEVRNKIEHACSYVNDRLLKPKGVWLDGYYYCEHAPEEYAEEKKYAGVPIDDRFVYENGKCPDWKPGLGLLEKAARDIWKTDTKDFVVYSIGDRTDTDGLLAIYAGGKFVWTPSEVKEHNDIEEARKLQKEHGADRVYIARDFADGAFWIKEDILKTLRKSK